jgi:hypothetical protein
LKESSYKPQVSSRKAILMVSVILGINFGCGFSTKVGHFENKPSRTRPYKVTETIITSFPQRWGRNMHDHSAVHSSISSRLKTAGEDEVRNVYDLALIIVDECCQVFFDRSKGLDQGPNLVDIFGDAIRATVRFSNRDEVNT